MKRLYIVLVLFVISVHSFAQKTDAYADIDQRALQIPDSLTRTTDNISRFFNASFHTDNDKARAVFIWTASNISFDIAHMFAINYYEKPEERIAQALKTRKGICSHYAAIFKDICTKCKIRCYVVEGYTKQKGFIDYIPHAWCAALINNEWYMFDPTWGSGYVQKSKFYREINNKFYKVAPAEMIKTHMPFDYLWQFLYQPVSNQEFYDNKTQEPKTLPYFSFPDSISVFESRNETVQLLSSARRIEANGVMNEMIADRIKHIKAKIEINRQNLVINIYNSAVDDCNEGIELFNLFIAYRNKQFQPMKPDAEIQKMLDGASRKFAQSRTKLNGIKNPDKKESKLIAGSNKLLDESLARLNDQQAWLNTYFSKEEKDRKKMFFK